MYITVKTRVQEPSGLRLRLHGTWPEPFRTEPDRIGFCLDGSVLEPVRSGSKRIQNWTYGKVGPVLDPVPDPLQNGPV